MTACPADTAEKEWNAGPGVYGTAIEINNVNDLSVVSDVNVFNGQGVHKTRRSSVLSICFFIRKLVYPDLKRKTYQYTFHGFLFFV